MKTTVGWILVIGGALGAIVALLADAFPQLSSSPGVGRLQLAVFAVGLIVVGIGLYLVVGDEDRTPAFLRTLMDNRWTGIIIGAAGLVAFVGAALADVGGAGGTPGLGALQGAGMVLGVFLLFIGFGLQIRNDRRRRPTVEAARPEPSDVPGHVPPDEAPSDDADPWGAS